MDLRSPILYGISSQPLEFYPPEGVPSAAATYRVWEGGAGNDDATLTSGTATMDTTSLAPSAAAGYSETNRKRIPLSTTTGLIVGEVYWLANVLGQSEQPRLAKVASASYAETETDLAYDYTTGATLKAHKQSFLVPDTIAVDISPNALAVPYRVEWSYTVAGIARRHWTWFDVARMSWQHGVRPQEVLDAYPTLAYQEFRDQRGQKYLRFIARGAERVQRDLRGRKIDPNTIAEGPDRDNLIFQAALMLIAESGIVPPGRDTSWVRERAAVYHRDLMNAGNLARADAESGAANTAPRDPMMFRS